MGIVIPNGLFPSHFLLKFSMHLSALMRATCPAHLTRDFFTLIICYVEYRLRSSPCSFLHLLLLPFSHIEIFSVEIINTQTRSPEICTVFKMFVINNLFLTNNDFV
jgi:hypothetical protein